VPDADRAQILHELVTRDFVGLEREVARYGEPALARVPQLRGGAEVLDEAPEATGLREVLDRLSPELADRVIFDLGLAHNLGYYTGAVFEVYDAGLGQPLGGGGRYDDLIGRFGADVPACGWALNVERLHLARVGEGR
jgi:ATP phosphoribosyltransferase regulatory subunit HisZ